MAIATQCQSCGAKYNLKDEYAGKKVKCKKCNAVIEIAPLPAVNPQGDTVFDRDKFLLKQKHFAISAKYSVWDEQGNPILFIERPAHLLRNLLAVFLGFVGGSLIFSLIVSINRLIPQDSVGGEVRMLISLLAFIGFFIGLIVIATLLYKRRHTYLYRDDSKQDLLLRVQQEQKLEFLQATYTLRDQEEQVLARFRKYYIYNIIRKRWYCYAPDGSLLCVAKEESIILSLLRRLLGSFFGLLRVNFIILDDASDTILGEFNRKFTLLDRYVLDMTADKTRKLDRRIAIALGVMLDTGERR